MNPACWASVSRICAGVGEGDGAGDEILRSADVSAHADRFKLTCGGEKGCVRSDGAVCGQVDGGHGNRGSANCGDGGAKKFDVLALVGGELVGYAGDGGVDEGDLCAARDGSCSGAHVGGGQSAAGGDVEVEICFKVFEVESEVKDI